MLKIGATAGRGGGRGRTWYTFRYILYKCKTFLKNNFENKTLKIRKKMVSVSSHRRGYTAMGCLSALIQVDMGRCQHRHPRGMSSVVGSGPGVPSGEVGLELRPKKNAPLQASVGEGQGRRAQADVLTGAVGPPPRTNSLCREWCHSPTIRTGGAGAPAGHCLPHS